MQIITGSTTFAHVSEPLSLTLLMIHTGSRSLDDYNRVQLKGDPDVEGFLPFHPNLQAVVALLIYSAFYGQDLFLPTLPAVTPLTRSYRTDSREVLGDDMGVSDTCYCHAHSLCGECQGQLVCHSPPMYLACYQ